MSYQFTTFENGQQAVSAFIDGQILQAATGHPNFEGIVQALKDGTATADLFNTQAAVNLKFAALTDRVEVVNGVVQIDGQDAPQALSDTIVNLMREGADFDRFVNFLELLSENPSHRSREQLFRFIEANGIHLNADGYLVLYKGVESDGAGGWQSRMAGTAFVDGVRVTGKIPARQGSVVTMPRSEVSDDPSVACHAGLHAGNFDYCQWFANGAILKVLVDPADVVSVPLDSNDQKIRVCRYVISDLVEDRHVGVAWDDEDDDFYEDDDDYYVGSHRV